MASSNAATVKDHLDSLLEDRHERLDVIGEAIARVDVDTFIAQYEKSRKK